MVNVVTLCGSTKFKDEFMLAQRELTLRGFIVISVGLFGHSGDVITDEQKKMLDELHLRKIDMADFIFVIDKDGYIGESTRREINYAMNNGKQVIKMSETSFDDVKNVLSVQKNIAHCSFDIPIISIHDSKDSWSTLQFVEHCMNRMSDMVFGSFGETMYNIKIERR